MACGSIAVSKAQISQIALEKEQLISMLAKTLGVETNQIASHQLNRGDLATAHNGRQFKIGYNYMHASYYGEKFRGVSSIAIIQRITSDGKITLELSVSSASQARAQELTEELTQAFERQSVVAQQTTVLKKLAQLGKLSSITQKDNGVTARLEITI